MENHQEIFCLPQDIENSRQLLDLLLWMDILQKTAIGCSWVVAYGICVQTFLPEISGTH